MHDLVNLRLQPLQLAHRIRLGDLGAEPFQATVGHAR